MTSDEARRRLAEIAAEAGSDISFGYTQITVLLADYYGLGNGTMDQAPQVREALFDRKTAIDIGADYFRSCLDAIEYAHPELAGDDLLLQGLIKYNSGSYQAPGNWYWQQWAGNIASYRNALIWAHGILEP